MKDFLTSNYHAHTWRCQHAYDTEREYVEAAIELGIRQFGFSDHVPCPYPKEFVSGIRMRMNQAEEYRDCIRKLQEEYKAQIQIYAGFEAEYIPKYFEEQKRMFDELGFDYMIMGQHFLNDGEMEGLYTGSPTWDDEFLKAYVDTILEGARTGAFLYIAHPDIINYQGPKKIYEKEMRRLCEGIKQCDIPLEVNILGMATNRQYPSEVFWKQAAEVGNDVVYGLDVHSLEHMHAFDAYRKCVKLVKKHKLHILDKLDVT